MVEYETKTVIMHEFYSKDVTSKAVVNATSAVPWSIKQTNNVNSRDTTWVIPCQLI